VVDGSRLLKPGMNGDYATVLELSWPDPESDKPVIRSRFVKCEDYEADKAFDEENERAYDCLLPLRNTELARVPPNFEPLSSNGSRDSVCTAGKFLCSLIKSSLNCRRNSRKYQIDSVLLMGGNIRGNADYPLGSFFSLEALEAEIKSDQAIGVVPMPGWLLAQGIEETHAGEPISGWMQYDEGVEEILTADGKPQVTHVSGEPLDKNKIYRVATKISDLTNGQSPTWTEYFTANKHLLPPKGSYVNINSELMGYFSYNLFRRLWSAISREVTDEGRCPIAGDTECDARERLAILDRSGSGVITVQDISVALREKLGYSMDQREMSLSQFVHNFADMDGDGEVTMKDFEAFCIEMEEDSIRDAAAVDHGNKENEQQIEVVVPGDESSTVVSIQMDGKQRNFLREERTSTDDDADEPVFPDFSQILVTALMGSSASSADSPAP